MAADAPGDPLLAELPLPDLGGDVGAADDGTRDELGKEGDIEQDGEEIPLDPARIPVDIDHIAEALEGEEGDADGQADLRHRQGQAQGVVEDLGEEGRVFVEDQQADVQQHRQQHRGLPSPPAGGAQAEEVVQPDGQQHNQHRHGLPEGVEHQARRSQQEVSGAVIPDQGVEQEHRGEEDEQKRQELKLISRASSAPFPADPARSLSENYTTSRAALQVFSCGEGGEE